MKTDEQPEPQSWDFNKDGLYIWPSKIVKREKNCIDNALKKICGKDWDKPLGFTRRDFRKR